MPSSTEGLRLGAGTGATCGLRTVSCPITLPHWLCEFPQGHDRLSQHLTPGPGAGEANALCKGPAALQAPPQRPFPLTWLSGCRLPHLPFLLYPHPSLGLSVSHLGTGSLDRPLLVGVAHQHVCVYLPTHTQENTWLNSTENLSHSPLWACNGAVDFIFF